MLATMWTYEHGDVTVHQIPALSDNFIYLIVSGDMIACVDPAESLPVITACEKLGRPLTHILNTHHHWDHTGGNEELKTHFGCTIVGASQDAARIPGIDQGVAEGDTLRLGGVEVAVLDIPGHTSGHIAFVIHTDKQVALFCGDTIFGAGCGRLFEGTPEQMWNSLQKLMTLDAQTSVYCAHEYTLNNLDFCLSKVSQSESIKAYIAWCKDMLGKGLPTIPGSLGREKQTNPMLLPAQSDFRKAYAKQHDINDDPVSVFTHIREARDHW